MSRRDPPARLRALRPSLLDRWKSKRAVDSSAERVVSSSIVHAQNVERGVARLPGDGCEVSACSQQPRRDGSPRVVRRARPHPGAAREHAEASVDRTRREGCHAHVLAAIYWAEEWTGLRATMPNPRVDVSCGLGRELRVARTTALGRAERENGFGCGVVYEIESGDLGAARTGREGDREKSEVALAERGGKAARFGEHARNLGAREGSSGRKRAAACAAHVADVAEILWGDEPQPTAVPQEAPNGRERDVHC